MFSWHSIDRISCSVSFEEAFCGKDAGNKPKESFSLFFVKSIEILHPLAGRLN